MSLTLPQLLALKLQQQGQQPQASPAPSQMANTMAQQNAGTAQGNLQNSAIQAMMQPNAQGMYSGLTNGISPILGALLAKPQTPNAQDIESGNTPPGLISQAGNWLSNMFGMGGSQ